MDLRLGRPRRSLQTLAPRAGCCASEVSVNRQAAHLVEQRAKADAQESCRLAPVATRGLERAENGLTLDRLDLRLEVERRAPGCVRHGAIGFVAIAAGARLRTPAVAVRVAEREVPRLQRAAGAEHRRPLDRVPQLAHVAGPRVM